MSTTVMLERSASNSVTISSMRTGFIYAIIRHDLNLIYVGQTINIKRIDRHFRNQTYVYEMTRDGLADVAILAADVSLDELDDVERLWMRQVVLDGWDLYNHLGPDEVWPHVPPEYRTSEAQRAGARASRAEMHERRKTDPVLDAWWREVAAMGAAAIWAKRAADPEFDAKCAAAALIGSQRGAEVRRIKRATDPEWAARELESARRGGLAGGYNGGKATAAQKWQCVECGLVSTPGGLGSHQKSSSHKGKISLGSDASKDSER